MTKSRTAVTELLDGYADTAGMWIVGEDIPSSTNRVSLSGETDAFGIPVAHVHYDDHANDIAMRAHGRRRGARIHEAVGATNTVETPPDPSTHNLGTSRMSQRPRDGVLDGSRLPEGAPALPNDAGLHGYLGAAPPAGHGVRHHHFVVHAVDVATLGVPRTSTPAFLGFTLYAHILARARLVPTFEQ